MNNKINNVEIKDYNREENLFNCIDFKLVGPGLENNKENREKYLKDIDDKYNNYNNIIIQLEYKSTEKSDVTYIKEKGLGLETDSCKKAKKLYTYFYDEIEALGKDSISFDTMNSFLNLFKTIICKHYNEQYKNISATSNGYKNFINDLDKYSECDNDKKLFDQLNKFAKLSNTIGNFILIPKNYSDEKGELKKLNNYKGSQNFDILHYEILEIIKKEFKILCKSKKTNNVEYIEKMFLSEFDYQKNGEGIFSQHSKENSSIDYCINYLKKLNEKIESRNIKLYNVIKKDDKFKEVLEKWKSEENDAYKTLVCIIKKI